VKRSRALLYRITATDLVRSKARLQDIIEPKGKQVLFIWLCGACAIDIKALGVPTPGHDVQDVAIVT
jgi:hypothetical protein